MTAYVDIHALDVYYGDTQVLFDVDLSVEQGDFIAVAGPSGCGKSTLLRTILGLERATAGSIRLGNKMLTTHGIHLAPEKRNIGWVPQDSALFPMLSVAENIAFSLGSSPRSVKKQARSARVQELLELIDMSALRDRMPSELSGGQAQRVALARALANNPTLVLMDEPFSGLDPVLRSELRTQIKSILKASNTTALLVTHDQTEALSIADKIALLHDGRIEQFGKPEVVYNTPASVWVADFLGEANRVRAIREGDIARTIFGDSAFVWMGSGNPAAEFDAIVRPESLQVTSGDNWQVVAVEYCGHDALTTVLDAEGHSMLVRIHADTMKSVGEKVGLQLAGPLIGFDDAA